MPGDLSMLEREDLDLSQPGSGHDAAPGSLVGMQSLSATTRFVLEYPSSETHNQNLLAFLNNAQYSKNDSTVWDRKASGKIAAIEYSNPNLCDYVRLAIIHRDSTDNKPLKPHDDYMIEDFYPAENAMRIYNAELRRKVAKEKEIEDKARAEKASKKRKREEGSDRIEKMETLRNEVSDLRDLVMTALQNKDAQVDRKFSHVQGLIKRMVEEDKENNKRQKKD